MNMRVVMAGLIGVTFFLLSHRPASAMFEVCPATLNFQAVGQPAPSSSASNLYGFDLTAFGPRTITTASIAFDTVEGWYVIDVPPTALTKKDRHYSSPNVSYIRHDYVSPVLYVRFPQPVTITHAWIFQATARDDGAYGWQARGNVTCDPPPTASPDQLRHSKPRNDPYKLEPMLDPKDRDNLSAPPDAASLVLAARASKALETVNCPEPFRDAVVKYQPAPNYPDVMVTRAAQTAVEVAVQGDGALLDAWVSAPSGVRMFDDASVEAATQATFIGARAYCRPVTGFYFFKVTFDPNR